MLVAVDLVQQALRKVVGSRQPLASRASDARRAYTENFYFYVENTLYLSDLLHREHQ